MAVAAHYTYQSLKRNIKIFGHTHMLRGTHPPRKKAHTTAEPEGDGCSPPYTNAAVHPGTRSRKVPQPAAQTSISSRAVTQPRSATHSPNGAEQLQKSEKKRQEKEKMKRGKKSISIYICFFPPSRFRDMCWLSAESVNLDY